MERGKRGKRKKRGKSEEKKSGKCRGSAEEVQRKRGNEAKIKKVTWY